MRGQRRTGARRFKEDFARPSARDPSARFGARLAGITAAMVLLDQTIVAGIKGGAWLPDLRHRHHDRPVHLRVLGQRAVTGCG